MRIVRRAAYGLFCTAALFFCACDGTQGKADMRCVAIRRDYSAPDWGTIHAALMESGIVFFIDETSPCIALSDFSRVSYVSYDELRQRLCDNDPRSTRLTEKLYTSFVFKDSANVEWSLLYMPACTLPAYAALKRRLSEHGVPWAAPRTSKTPIMPYAIALAYCLWLILKKSHVERFTRLIYALPWTLMLLKPCMTAFVVYAAAETASMAALSLMRPAKKRVFLHALWPYGIVVCAAFILRPELYIVFVPSLAMSTVLFFLYGRIDHIAASIRWKNRRKAPRFVVLSPHTSLRASYYAFIPLSAVLVVLTISQLHVQVERNGGISIVSSARRTHTDEAEGMLREHVIRQYAVSYGRLNDIPHSPLAYTPAYRYTAINNIYHLTESSCVPKHDTETEPEYALLSMLLTAEPVLGKH